MSKHYNSWNAIQGIPKRAGDNNNSAGGVSAISRQRLLTARTRLILEN